MQFVEMTRGTDWIPETKVSFFANRLGRAPRGQSAVERSLYWFTLAREGSSDPLMHMVCRNRDLMSKYELGKVNFVLTSGRQDSIRDELRSQNPEPTACERSEYPC